MSRIRTIKPSFFINEHLGDLPPLNRLLFIGLWTLADSEGRLEDRPRRIKAQILPYDECDCDELLDSLHETGFIVRYVVDGSGYIEIPKFRDHQRITGKEAETKSNLPAPEQGETTGKQRGNNGETAVAQEGKGKEGNRKGKDKDVCAERSRGDPSPPPADEPGPLEAVITPEEDETPEVGAGTDPDSEKPREVILLPLNNGNYAVIESQVAEWQGLYPAVNVLAELRKMRGWLLANPSRRKTLRGILRFVTGWLAREQDRGRVLPTASAGGKKPSAITDDFSRKDYAKGATPLEDIAWLN